MMLNRASEEAKYCMIYLISCILGDNAITTTYGADIRASATSRTPGPALPLVSGGGVLRVRSVRCLRSNSWSPAAPGGGHEDSSHEPHSGPRDHGDIPAFVNHSTNNQKRFQVNVSTKLLEQADILLLEQEDSGYVGDMFGFWVEGVIQVSSL